MIIAGQGTCGLELSQQAEDLDAVICCTGGGGLITGIALAFEGMSPDTQIWTAEPTGHQDWQRALQLGSPVSNQPGTRSICDAILTPQPGAITWAVGLKLLTGGLAVGDEHIREAVRGAAALAAALFVLPDALRGKRIGIVLTGGNVDEALFADVLAG